MVKSLQANRGERQWLEESEEGQQKTDASEVAVNVAVFFDEDYALFSSHTSEKARSDRKTGFHRRVKSTFGLLNVVYYTALHSIKEVIAF